MANIFEEIWDFLDGDAEELEPIDLPPAPPNKPIGDISVPELGTGIPGRGYFEQQNNLASPGTTRVPWVGDDGDNLVYDADYTIAIPTGVGSSYGMAFSYRDHKRDSGTELFGHGGDDWVLGYGGNDTLHGGSGDDTLEGGTGNDIIWGGDDRDLLLGGEDNDDMHGGNHDDVLDGANGNDTLVGDAGADTMYGGRGNDVYVVADRGDRVFEDASAEGGNADKIYTTLSSYDLNGYDKGVDIEDLQFIG